MDETQQSKITAEALIEKKYELLGAMGRASAIETDYYELVQGLEPRNIFLNADNFYQWATTDGPFSRVNVEAWVTVAEKSADPIKMIEASCILGCVGRVRQMYALLHAKPVVK